MKLRSALFAVGLGTGAALANRALGRTGGDLAQGVPGDRRIYRWRGMNVTYSSYGDPDNPDVVCLHAPGATESSYEYRPIATRLVDDHHVIAPDFPGYGLSDRPPLLYSASLYQAFVADFLADVPDDPIVLASSLSGAYAVDAPVDVSELVLICPTTDTFALSVVRRSVLRSPILGTAIYNAITSKPAIRHFSTDHGFYDPEALTEDRVEYLWQAAHQPGARFAPASFLSGHLDPDIDLAEAIAERDAPVTLLWGRETEVNPLREGRTLAEETDARLLAVDYAKLLPHVEHPDEVATALAGALPRIDD